MIIPCIDLMDGKVVQLVQGKDKFLELPEPLAVLEKFAAYPEIQVIDLDAAMGKAESNAEIVRELCRRKPCRVGGGIRNSRGRKRWWAMARLRPLWAAARSRHKEFVTTF